MSTSKKITKISTGKQGRKREEKWFDFTTIIIIVIVIVRFGVKFVSSFSSSLTSKKRKNYSHFATLPTTKKRCDTRDWMCIIIATTNSYPDSTQENPLPPQQSFFTLVVYLNNIDIKSGGSTRFYTHHVVDYRYQPRRGDCVCFEQGKLYDDEILKHDAKFVMRSEVMYKLNIKVS